MRQALAKRSRSDGAAAAALARLAEADALEAMPLPRPGKDFAWFPDPTEAVPSTPPPGYFELRGDDELRTHVVIKKDGQWFCAYCEHVVSDLDRHLEVQYKEAKMHYRWKDGALEAQASLREQGWRLHREGVKLENVKFHCKLCQKSGPWYDDFEPHVRASRGHWSAVAAMRTSTRPGPT